MFPPLTLFFPANAPTPPPAGMRVVPCSALNVGAEGMVRTIGLVVDVCLDVQTLEHSLVRLFSDGIGSAHDPDLLQAFEFQIPYTFNSRNPAVAFTAEDYRGRGESHARPDIRALVDSADCQPFVCEFPSLDMYLRSKTCPTSTDGFLMPNTPMVHVHIAVFDELTVIGVTSSQVMFDVVGTQTLLRAWTRLLAGENIDVIQGMDWDVAPFESFRGACYVNFVRGYGSRLPGLLVPLVRSWMRHPEELKDLGSSTEWACEHGPLPEDDSDTDASSDCDADLAGPALLASFAAAAAFDEARMATGYEEITQGKSKKTWIAAEKKIRGISYSVRKRGDETPIHVHIPVNLRPMGIFPGKSTLTHPYINNTSSTIPLPPLAASAFQTEPLGELALRIRRATTLYHTDLRTIQAELCWLNWHPMLVLGRHPSGSQSELQVNWCEARLSELDFSGAAALGSEMKGRGRVLFVSADTTPEDHTPLQGNGPNGAILMEDENAIWMSQVKRRRGWDKFRQSGHIKFM
ncbi:hypothetical protein B0H17DRAFT_1202202 [Mycena rosella]|uniref:Uncharacterized protein n=1 Tax=Mycena rosella TaxID=1033263 RepID=A0AAD7DE46_MYCRO|nr:hypothetical protein B0H17DRAFT_1202202 [Mycena rosella]